MIKSSPLTLRYIDPFTAQPQQLARSTTTTPSAVPRPLSNQNGGETNNQDDDGSGDNVIANVNHTNITTSTPTTAPSQSHAFTNMNAFPLRFAHEIVTQRNQIVTTVTPSVWSSATSFATTIEPINPYQSEMYPHLGLEHSPQFQ